VSLNTRGKKPKKAYMGAVVIRWSNYSNTSRFWAKKHSSAPHSHLVNEKGEVWGET